MSFTQCQFENWGVITAYDYRVVHRVWTTRVIQLKKKRKKNELFKLYKLFLKIKRKTKVTVHWRYYKKDITNINNCRGFPEEKGKHRFCVKKKKRLCFFFGGGIFCCVLYAFVYLLNFCKPMLYNCFDCVEWEERRNIHLKCSLVNILKNKMARSVKYRLADNMKTRLKFHGVVIKWCTERGWPVNCMTVISAQWWSDLSLKKGRKLHVPLASYGRRLRGRRGVSIFLRGSLMVIKGRRFWTEGSETPLFTQACPVVTPCAFSQPSSNLHRSVQAS